MWFLVEEDEKVINFIFLLILILIIHMSEIVSVLDYKLAVDKIKHAT